MDIHTDIVYSNTEYDVIIYVRSEVIGEKLSKMPPPTASGGWNHGSSYKIIKFYILIEDKRPHKPAGNGIAAPSGL